MTTFKACQFEVTVDGPYPCWITVRGSELNREPREMCFRHNELADLQFILERGRQEAMRKLRDNAHEVL